MIMLVDIYRSARHEGMYLYVKKGEPLGNLPESLMTHFGKAEHAMLLALTPDKKLALADAKAVIAAIEEQHFYLQLPPRQHGSSIVNDKLPL